MKTKKKFQVSIFIKYLTTNLLVIFAFLVLLVPIYNTMYSVIKNNTIENDTKKVHENIMSLNNKIEKMITISKLIRNDLYISKLANITNALESNEYYYITGAQDSINAVRAQYDLSIQAYVVFKNNNTFISNIISSEDYNSVYKNFLIYEDTTGQLIRDTALYSNKTMEFLPVQRIKYLDGKVYNGLTCIIKMSSRGNVDFDSALVCTLDISDILSSFELAEKNKDEFLQISDKDGNILLNYNYNGEAIKLKDKKSDYVLDGEKYSLIHSRVEYGNLNIIRGIKESVFDNKINTVLNIMRLYIIAAIIIAFLISGFMTYRQYSGIRKVLDVVKPKSYMPLRKNEYEYISDAFMQVSDKKEEFEKEMLRMRSAIRSSMLEKLFLHGIYVEREKLEFEQYVGERLEYYCVISIDLLNKLDIKDIFEHYSKISRYIKSTLQNKFNKVLEVNHGASEIIYLIHLKNEDKANNDEIFKEMKEITRDVKSNFNQALEVGISNIGYDIGNVHACYQQARYAIRQINDQFEIPVNIVVKNDSQDHLFESLNLEQQLFELILAGDKEALEGLFQRIIRHSYTCAFITEQDIMQLFFTIRSPIINAKNALNKEIDVPKYHDNYSVSKLIELLEATSITLCDVVLEKKRSNNNDLKNSIINCLNEEYANVNLCAALVAEKFNISEKYVYNFIKEQTGISFGKYVENIRLQKAKDLLKDSEISAAEISQSVGFNSVNTFYKAFNRNIGVAPITWRENLRKKQD